MNSNTLEGGELGEEENSVTLTGGESGEEDSGIALNEGQLGESVNSFEHSAEMNGDTLGG